jgi:hypothetical protein
VRRDTSTLLSQRHSAPLPMPHKVGLPHAQYDFSTEKPVRRNAITLCGLVGGTPYHHSLQRKAKRQFPSPVRPIPWQTTEGSRQKTEWVREQPTLHVTVTFSPFPFRLQQQALVCGWTSRKNEKESTKPCGKPGDSFAGMPTEP